MNLLDVINSKYKKYNLQSPVQVKRDNVANAINMTAPTQIEPHRIEGEISSAASDPSKQTEALRAQALAQVPVSYTFVRDLNLPFSNKAKLFKLATGQQVVVLEKKGPTVLQTYYNVGSMNEQDEQRGISHFNEHMAFNGSVSPLGKTLGAGDFFRMVNDMGAITNASTGFSQTDYFVTSQLLDNNVFDKSVFMQAQQLLYPEHSAEMIEKEKGPVTSEISMVGDQPENTALSNCIKNLFQIKTTSADLVAGTIENINNLDRNKTLDYYNLWYTPDNCATVVTGEVPTQEAINTVAKHFNKFSNVDTSKRKYQDFVGITSPVRTDVRTPRAKSSIVALGFAGAKNNSTKENITMEVLMTALLGSKTARISKELNKIQSSAFMNIERVGNRPTDPKAILIASQMTPEKTEDVIKTIYTEIDKVTKEPLNADELETAKKTLKMTFSKISENSQLLNNLIGNALLDNDLNYVENYLAILDSVTTEDVTAFAKKYLDLNKASLSVVHPQNLDDATIKANYDKANMTSVAKNNPSFSKKINFKGSINEKSFDLSKVKQYKLANNMELVFNSNNSDIASSILQMKTPAPAMVKPAVPAILAIMLNEGSKNKSYETFYNDVHKAGMMLKFEADFQSISANAECLADDLPMAMDLMKEVFEEPRLTEKSLSYAKKLVREAVLNSDNSANEYALKELFPNRPEYSTKEELLNTIESTTLADVTGLFEYIKNNSVAKGIFTAPVNKKPHLEQSVVQKLSNSVHKFKPFSVQIFNSYTPVSKDVVITNIMPRNQADIVQGFKFKTNLNPKDQAIFRLLNTILGDGPSSRLFNDLREQQKLAYRVESNIDTDGNTGLLTLGIKTTTDDKVAGVQQFDNVQKSLDGFKKHVDLLKNQLVKPEELAAAKLRVKTKLLNSIESSSSQTTVLNNSKDSFLGLNSLNENLKLVDTITAQDIQNAANYIFSSPSVTSILASEDTINHFNSKK